MSAQGMASEQGLDAFLDPIRDDPRFQALLEKYGEEASDV